MGIPTAHGGPLWLLVIGFARAQRQRGDDDARCDSTKRSTRVLPAPLTLARA